MNDINWDAINWDAIDSGDLVLLKWTGYRRVPKWLHQSWATVLRRNKAGNLVVQAHSECTFERTIQPIDITRHRPKQQ